MNLRFASLHDGKICNKFYNDYYHRDRTLKQWEWEFCSENKSKDNNEAIPFIIAESDQEVVGVQALIPIKFIDKDGIYLTAKSEETLVSPKMRGKQLFAKMYDKLFDYAESVNIKHIWGFTPAGKAFNKIGFETPSTTKQLIKTTNFSSIISAYTEINSQINPIKKTLIFFAGIFIHLWSKIASSFSLLTRFDKSFEFKDIYISNDEFALLTKNFIKTYGGTTIYRDRDYMNWRIFNNPHCRANVVGAYKEGELIGFVAFSIGDDNCGYIIDIIAANKNNNLRLDKKITSKLIDIATKRLKRMGAKLIRAWSMNDHTYDVIVRKCASKLGYLKINKGHIFVLHNCKNNIDQKSFDSFYITRIYTEGTNG